MSDDLTGNIGRFRLFILKLVSFCNLNCSYCYMFNNLDQSYVGKPDYMSAEIAVQSLRAIERYVSREGPRSASVTLHGGEPTLWPLESFRTFFAEVARITRGGTTLSVNMQTNLWQRPKLELLELCKTFGVGLGVSLDGPRSANDANRYDFARRGSHDKVLGNVRWMMENGYENLFSGFLSVMQPTIAPEEYMDWLRSLPITTVNLLWPIEFNQVNKPWKAVGEQKYALDPLYGTWAERLFESWWRLDKPELYIKLFADAVQAQVGGGRTTDMLGALSFGSLVINTDGAIEMADYFRTSKNEGSFTGYSVLTDDFDAVVGDARFAKLRLTAEQTPETCGHCAHLAFCRGGTLSGRLNASGEVTAERSVLCYDHMQLFDAVAKCVDAERLTE